MGSEIATGFTVEIENRKYLITARHFINSMPLSSSVEIFRNNEWLPMEFKSITVDTPNVDIAVLALNQQISREAPVNLGSKDYALSQSVFFVGFPFGLSINDHALNGGSPFPLVKRGIIAGLSNGVGEPFIVDGINNPGFSGGPVVTVEDINNPKIIGVVSGYRFSPEPVFQQGQQSSDLSVKINTGLLIAYETDYALTAIEKNPIGYLLR
jgi:S1-C subfamily serine protease